MCVWRGEQNFSAVEIKFVMSQGGAIKERRFPFYTAMGTSLKYRTCSCAPSYSGSMFLSKQSSKVNIKFSRLRIVTFSSHRL
jgi:hypothetical protein